MNNPLRRIDPIIGSMLLVSAALYVLEFLIFGRAEEIGFGLLGNLAFLPLYVLFVTLMIERLLKRRERESLRQKLNMVIGVFFSEVGTSLLKDGFGFVSDCSALRQRLMVAPGWGAAEFRAAEAFLADYQLALDSRRGDLGELKSFLVGKRGFLLGLLENPNLLEHDTFTELLWAVFHLLEELEARRSLTGLPESDLDHLSGDIKRAYSLLLREWLVYLHHLKSDYPYLFSLAVRLNPMNPDAHAEIGY